MLVDCVVVVTDMQDSSSYNKRGNGGVSEEFSAVMCGQSGDLLRFWCKDLCSCMASVPLLPTWPWPMTEA